jgi:hypothetical protein
MFNSRLFKMMASNFSKHEEFQTFGTLTLNALEDKDSVDVSLTKRSLSEERNALVGRCFFSNAAR